MPEGVVVVNNYRGIPFGGYGESSVEDAHVAASRIIETLQPEMCMGGGNWVDALLI